MAIASTISDELISRIHFCLEKKINLDIFDEIFKDLILTI